MLVHPWDAPVDDEEWRRWLAGGRDFGQLVSVGAEWPIVVPTHFLLTGDTVWVHLARANPIWPSIESNGRAVLTVIDEYAYVPSYWRAPPGAPEADGVPTSYYAVVQLRCRADVIDDPAEKASLLARQLGHFQPEGGYANPAPDGAHHRLLAGIRGLRLTVVETVAKFKFDDHKPEQMRRSINAGLRERGTGRDTSAAIGQSRRAATPSD